MSLLNRQSKHCVQLTTGIDLKFYLFARMTHYRMLRTIHFEKAWRVVMIHLAGETDFELILYH